MSESKPKARDSSRLVAMVAVVLLTLIAVAGIVLATLSRRPATPPAASEQARNATTRNMPGMTASAVQAAEAAAERLDHVSFAPGSDKVPDDAAPLIATFIESARARSSKLRLTTKFTAGERRAKELELANARTLAVRRMIEASGKAVAMQYETIEMPAGTLSERDANRLVLSLH